MLDGVVAWKSFGWNHWILSFNEQGVWGSPWNNEGPKISLHKQHNHHPTTEGQLVLLPQSRRWWEDSFFTHHGIGKWMEQNTRLTCSYRQVYSFVSPVLQSSFENTFCEFLFFLHMLAKCLKFWVVMLLAVSFVILLNGTPEGNTILWQSTALTSKLYIQRIPAWVSEAFIQFAPKPPNWQAEILGARQKTRDQVSQGYPVKSLPSNFEKLPRNFRRNKRCPFRPLWLVPFGRFWQFWNLRSMPCHYSLIEVEDDSLR